MASPIDVQLILADAAQAIGGKVSMLGAGWSVTGTPTAPQAVVGLIKVPWDRANEQLPLTLALVDADGQLVRFTGPDGVDQQIEFETVIEVGRPPGSTPGTPIDASFTVNVQPLPLTPGRYTWRLDISGDLIATSFQVNAGIL
jgi:hypothetical protein